MDIGGDTVHVQPPRMRRKAGREARPEGYAFRGYRVTTEVHWKEGL